MFLYIKVSFVSKGEGPRDSQNLSAITTLIRYIEVLFHIFHYYRDEKIIPHIKDFVI